MNIMITSNWLLIQRINEKNHKSHEIMTFMTKKKIWELVGHESHDFMTFGKKVLKKPSVRPKVISILNLNKKLNFCIKNTRELSPSGISE